MSNNKKNYLNQSIRNIGEEKRESEFYFTFFFCYLQDYSLVLIFVICIVYVNCRHLYLKYLVSGLILYCYPTP